MRKISLAELAEHTNPENAWLSLNGIVYDVSVYLHYHPGGEILLKGCGKECAGLFRSFVMIQINTTHGSMPRPCFRITRSAICPTDSLYSSSN
jgi:cytochrome b involved in lipid metabolism